jgi:flagellar hook-associated protein 2
MAGVTSVGVGSGLDLESLLAKLVDAERLPAETRLARREATIQASISAFGGLKSALSGFQTSLAGLRDAASLGAPAASVSDSTLFSASAAAGAASGQYQVQVLNLAAAQKLVSGDFASGGALVGSGTLTIETGSNSFDVGVAAGTTLAQLRDLVNDAPGNSLVSASLLTVDDGNGGTVTRLVLAARASGAANAVSVTVADDDATNTDAAGLSRFFFSDGNPASQLAGLTAARDARIAIDGLTVSSATNTFVDAIDRVTITALREPEDPLDPESAQLSIARGKGTIIARIQAFVAAYNEARATIRDLTRFDQASGEAGQLLGDATVRNVDSGLRRVLASAVDGPATYDSLASIGIVSQRDGSLALDSARLNAALDKGFDDVVELFSGEDGVGARFAAVLDGVLSGTGSIRARTDGFDRQLRDISQQREALDLRVTAIENRFRQQFIALDSLVARLQSSGDYLLAQLENTSAIITGRGKS